jgi:predicted permease
VVVLGDGVWKRRFGSDSGIVGRSIVVAQKPYTVVGVLAPGFAGLSGTAEIWLPSMAAGAEDLGLRRGFAWHVVGRLRPGVTVAQARGAVAALGARIDEADPVDASSRWSAAARTLDETRADSVIRRSVLLLLGAAVLVLLIACVNIASVSIAQGAGRRREIAIRLAVGATRGRLVRQLLTESVLLALAGGVVGLAVAVMGVRLLESVNLASGATPFRDISGLTLISLDSIRIDGAVLVFMLGASVATGLLFGVLPALQATRREVCQDLRSTPQYRAGRSRVLGPRNMLVVAEIALSLVLLVSAGLLLNSLAPRLAIEPGTVTSKVLTFRLMLSDQVNPAHRVARLEELESRLAGLAGVTAAGLADCPPVGGRCGTTALWFRDRPNQIDAKVGRHVVSAGYFDTMKIPLQRCRLFTPADRLDATKVAIVSATAARTLWPGEDPIGKPVALGMNGFGDRVEVIGVVGDVRYGAIEEPPRADVYVSFRQAPGNTGGFVRTVGDPRAVIGAVRLAVRAVDPLAPIYEMATMRERVRMATLAASFSTGVLGIFAGIALALAAVGVYGVLSQAVGARTREIGVRMALGAQPADIIWLVLARGLALALTGVALGHGGAAVASRSLKSFLYEVAPYDAVTYAALSATLTMVGLAAAYLPARRATRVNPVVTLRAE